MIDGVEVEFILDIPAGNHILLSCPWFYSPAMAFILSDFSTESL